MLLGGQKSHPQTEIQTPGKILKLTSVLVPTMTDTQTRAQTHKLKTLAASAVNASIKN